MRLIDADAINFEEIFGGQSEFAKNLRDAAQELIDKQPTAFDKEKVIEELKSPYNYSISVGRHITTVNRATEIVEKGGIE